MISYIGKSGKVCLAYEWKYCELNTSSCQHIVSFNCCLIDLFTSILFASIMSLSKKNFLTQKTTNRTSSPWRANSTINYCQLSALSTFSILYHLVKGFMIYATNRNLFSIAELIVSNILSFQILSTWMVATCARNTKLEVYCRFQKQTSLFYKT